MVARESETTESSAVRITRSSNATHPTLLAGRMRSYTLVFVVLATVLLYTEYVSAREICHQDNCITPDKCDELVKGQVLCPEQGTSCCSVVKSEFRTHCHHHGGICTDQCASSLQRSVVDCPNNQVCCVLI